THRCVAALRGPIQCTAVDVGVVGRDATGADPHARREPDLVLVKGHRRLAWIGVRGARPHPKNDGADGPEGESDVREPPHGPTLSQPSLSLWGWPSGWLRRVTSATLCGMLTRRQLLELCALGTAVLGAPRLARAIGPASKFRFGQLQLGAG